MTVQLGLLLALACALATNLAFLWKHKGATQAPDVDIRHPLRSATGLFSSKWWTIGFSVALGAWVLHVAALALATISLVQAVISGGLVFLAVLADRWFGFELGKREWLGVALTAIGLAFLGLTVQTGAEGTHSSYSISGMIAFEGAMVFLGALLLITHRVQPHHHHRGLMLGAAAGILFGVSDISIKALTGTVPGEFLSIISPWTLVAVLASIAAFYASARGLHVCYVV
jgi:drug/metabolite transporter (DMT)-like permease